MKIVVGLGNPGPKYETTRHNAGFLAVDRLVERWNASGPVVRNLGECFEASFGGEKILLLKPQTFMNLSGRCVAPLIDFYKVEPGSIVVVHDDVDLKPLTFRIKTGGGSGGHNGLKSIDESIGAARTGYHRVRIGIGKPASVGARMDTADYVLQRFSNEELKGLDPLLDCVADAIERILSGDVSGAMNEYNKRERAEEK